MVKLRGTKLDLWLTSLAKRKELIGKKLFHQSTKDSFEIIMAIVAHFNFKLNQIVVKTAFLNKDLYGDVYMVQSIGFEKVAIVSWYVSLKNLSID